MLKKEYEAPALMVETYMLDTSIAATCGTQINDRDQACYDKWFDEGAETFALFSAGQQSFADKAHCDCYYSSGGEGFFAS